MTGISPATVKADPDRLYQANAEAAEFFQRHLSGHQPATSYLSQRGIADAAEAGSPWQLGYAPTGWTTTVNHLRSRGFGDDEIYAAGLASHDRHGRLIDRFRDRLTFPVHDPAGRVLGFTARDLSGDPDTPKYLNTPETRVYRKGEVLYGLGPQLQNPPAGDRAPVVVTVEGPTDAIAVATMAQETAGNTPVYAASPCGTALTDRQLHQLHQQLPDANLAVAFDGDTAGRRAFTRTYPLLRSWPGRRYGIELPDGRDPAELLAEHGPAAGLAELAGRAKPAARMAAALLIEQLIEQGRITRPREWVADRLLAYEAIADYFVDDPADTPALAREAATRLGITEGEVVQGVIDHAVPDREPTSIPEAKVQRAREAVARRQATLRRDRSDELEPATPTRTADATRQPGLVRAA